MSKQDRIWIKWMKLGAKYGCHQRPDRSFSVAGYQFPVCARCTGMILSSAIAAILYMFVKFPIIVYVIMVAIMGVDGGLQYFNIKESTNSRRFITGCFGGFGLTSIKISIFFALCKRIWFLISAEEK